MTFRALLASATTLTLLAACGGADDDAVAEIDTDTDRRLQELQRETDRVAERTERMANTVAAKPQMMNASFPVMNAGGYEIGTVSISDTADGVDVMLDVTSIPEGTHAIHFHETGSCDGPDFTSAGGHYNPTSVNHGFDADAPKPHAGDMRNFDAPQSGVVKKTIKNDRVTLSARSDMAPLRDADGTALIIHAGADDYESQPSGAAGGRIACAVIN